VSGNNALLGLIGGFALGPGFDAFGPEFEQMPHSPAPAKAAKHANDENERYPPKSRDCVSEPKEKQRRHDSAERERSEQYEVALSL
jgi:hypothetical protein